MGRISHCYENLIKSTSQPNRRQGQRRATTATDDELRRHGDDKGNDAGVDAGAVTTTATTATTTTRYISKVSGLVG